MLKMGGGGREGLNKVRSPFCKLRDGERRKERKKGDQNEVKYIQMLSEILPDH